MDTTFWHKQTKDSPLFPDLLWSRPETKRTRGKLLIIGGSSHGFAAPAEAYQAAVTAGVGTARVLMPDAIKAVAGKLLETVDFAPSTTSGSFSQKALTELFEHAAWADGVLLAGDHGRNSETAILIEKFLASFSGQVTLTKDTVDYALNQAKSILQRPNTLLVVTMAQLQKLYQEARLPEAITFDMDLLRLVEALHRFTSQHPVHLIVKQLNQLMVASDGQVSTTLTTDTLEDHWRVQTAAHASVWWLQNPLKSFEALTISLVEAENVK